MTDTGSLEELVDIGSGMEGLEPIRLKDVADIST